MNYPDVNLSRADVEAALDDLIRNQRAIDFQRIAMQLARELRPGIVASEITKDGGEDGFLVSTATDEKYVLAVACSITATWDKIGRDLERIKARKPNLSALWFYTPKLVTAQTTDPWKAKARDSFGIDLTVFSREDIVQRLLDPRNHYLARDHLLLRATQLARFASVPAFQSRIRAFFDEYLESETGPVPFGGRNSELDLLDAWLRDNQAAPRYLITGPAGRGKSALLVRWVERLQGQGMLAADRGSGSVHWDLVFVPISMRFGTNAQHVFHQAVAERLAIIADQTLETPAEDPAGFYADKARELLAILAPSGKRVLVVLDGLDEALRGEFDAALFPRVLSPNIRVLLSARWLSGDHDSAGWLRRLDWVTAVRCQSMNLGPLDEAAIGQVLLAMGAPLETVANDRALVSRLAELTEGEPLLVGCYATDLWKEGEKIARITRADLERMEPGFGAYLDRWLELQRKAWHVAGEQVSQREVDAALMILAFACGPMEGADLQRLVSRLSGKTEALTPQRLLEPLRRFVIGDGSPERGYTLSHSKIGQHLQMERFRDVRGLVEEAFAGWGREVVAEVNRPNGKVVRIPRYLLQFYRLHLQAVDAPAVDFLTLVEDGWRRAWESYEGSQQGFCRDVRAAWTAVRREGQRGQLGAQLRCALTLSSIRSLGHHVPRQVIIVAVRREVLSIRQAVHFASFLSRPEYIGTLRMLTSEYVLDPRRQQDILTEVLAATAKPPADYESAWARAMIELAGRATGEQRNRAVREALVVTKALSDLDARVGALSMLAPHLTGQQRSDVLSEALALAKVIPDEHHRARALSELAAHLTAEQLTEALTIAKSLGDADARARVLGDLAGHLTAEQLAEALAAARAIGGADARARALSGLAGSLTGEQRSDALSEALAAARDIGYEAARAGALTEVAAALVGDQRRAALSEALAAAKAINEAHPRAMALCSLAGHLTGEERTDALRQALAAAKRTRGGDARANTLCMLARHLADKQLGQAVAAARTIRDEHARASALGGLARHLTGKQLDEALAVAKAIRDQAARARALGELADHLTGEQRSDALCEALAAVRAIGDEQVRVGAFGALAEHLTGEQRSEMLAEALAAANTIGFEYDRASAINELAGHLTGEQLTQVLAAAKAINDETARISALIELARHLTGEQHSGILSEALATARGIGCAGDRSSALGELVAHLADEQRPEVLSEALAAARVIADDGERVGALGGLAGHLTGEERRDALREALASVKNIGDEDDRARALSRLAGHLTREQIAEALAVAKAIRSGRARASALRGLAPHLAGQLLVEALAEAKAIYKEDARARALGGLGAHLGGEQLEEAFAAAKAITRQDARVQALGELVGHLTGRKLAQVQAAAKGIGEEDPRARALIELAEQSAGEQLAEVLAAAKALDVQYIGACALLDLAGHLTGRQRSDALSKSLAATKAMGEGEVRDDVLGRLTSHFLIADQLAEALAAANAIGNPNARAAVLSELLGHLKGDQRREALTQALAAVKSIGDEHRRAAVLIRLSEHLSDRQLEEFFFDRLRDEGQLTRPEFLNAMRPFMATLLKAGGERALLELRQAIHDTAVWYP